MNRRVFILASCASVAWPCAGRAQHPNVLVVGYLYAGSPEGSPHHVRAFRSGLEEAGYIEGKNVFIDYRWGHNDVRLLPELAADLVRRGVAVIAVPGSMDAVRAAKNATKSIPIVFSNASDPVKSGIVASLSRPGGNVTGVTDMGRELSSKRLGLLRELLPAAKRLAVLTTPNRRGVISDVRPAARAAGLEIELLTVGSSREIDDAFAALVQRRADALWVDLGSLFYNHRARLVELAARHAVPAIYPLRDFAEIGGLMSYGASLANRNRQAGIYVGRILNGEKAADLPIMRAVKFEFVLNLQTANVLGIAIPSSLLVQADEVIELNH